MNIGWLAIGTVVIVFFLLLTGVIESGNQQKPGMEPLMVTSHSQEDVYNEHMLLNCLIELNTLKGGVSDVK